MNIYKLKHKFVKAYTSDKFNFGFDYHFSSKCRDVKIALRQLQKNEKFQDLFFWVFHNSNKKKEHLIVQRLKRDYRFKEFESD